MDLASTREVILGTENGQIYEIAVDEVDKKEKYVKLLFELTELPEAIMGLQVMWTSWLQYGVSFIFTYMGKICIVDRNIRLIYACNTDGNDCCN